MQRIMIIGPGNAGKSTLAVELGKRLGLPVYHLDKYFWLPNWTIKDRPLFIAEQQELVKQDKWIIEGDFARSYSLRAEYADTIILLNFPRRIIIPRFFRRAYQHRGKTRSDMTEGNIERINYEYIKWLALYDRTKPLNIIKKYQNTKATYIFTKPRQVKKFLKQVQINDN